MPETLPLRDVIAIEPIWWPPAPLWWLLAGLALIIAWFGIKWLAGMFAYQYGPLKKAAMQELGILQQNKDLDNQELAAQLSGLLKRAAQQRFPEQKPASMNGEQWVAFLESSVPGGDFGSAGKMSLATAQYQSCPDIDRSAMIDAARRWIRAL